VTDEEVVMFDERLPYQVFDADNHFYEPLGVLEQYLESEFHDRVAVDYTPGKAAQHRAKIVAEQQERQSSVTEQLREAVPGSALGRGNPLRDKSAEERERIVEEFRVLEGAYQDRDRRVEVMDAQGIEGALMFPTGVGVGIWSNNLDDPAANLANVRAFNRWVQDAWGFDFKGRIFTPAVVGLVDLEAGLAELDRCLEAGAKTVLLPPGPLYDRAPADPYYDGLWERLNESGARAVFHLGYTNYQAAGKHYGYDPDTHYFDGFDAFQWLNYWGDRPIMETIASLIFDNLFTRFPNVKVGIIEHGTVYLPYLLRKMDHAVLMGKATRHGTLPDRPSQIFQQHFVVAPYPEENITRVLEVVGPDCLVFGSDFPHPEGLPDPVSYVHQLDRLPEPIQRNIMRDNLANFLSIG
jgi:predicted TIM-barrel fold metal-dependent hydrolase